MCAGMAEGQDGPGRIREARATARRWRRVARGPVKAESERRVSGGRLRKEARTCVVVFCVVL